MAAVRNIVGVIHLTPPPGQAAVAQMEPSAIPLLPEDGSPRAEFEARGSRRSLAETRWYEFGVSLLILASGAVALYRLIWMGQP